MTEMGSMAYKVNVYKAYCSLRTWLKMADISVGMAVCGDIMGLYI